jgi:hypothetical protein
MPIDLIFQLFNEQMIDLLHHIFSHYQEALVFILLKEINVLHENLKESY